MMSRDIPETVRIIDGPHKGLVGNITSIPWLGNLWNLRVEVNVPKPGNAGNRTWVYVWRWHTEPVTSLRKYGEEKG